MRAGNPVDGPVIAAPGPVELGVVCRAHAMHGAGREPRRSGIGDLMRPRR